MRLRFLLVFVFLTLAGCAGMDLAECRSANWYQLGERDGNQYGTRPQIDQYAHQCSAHGVTAVEKDYMTGWVDGYREWTKRVHASDCCAP